jgi:phosphomannomutase/phosphoglucomutase
MNKINPSIFREYDIRGIADRDFDETFALRLGQVYPKFLANKTKPKIAVGKDCRLTSDRYAEALVQGLRESGCDVIRLGICPSPLTYFSLFHLNVDGAIMVTGSHNPGDFNGFKICVGKTTIHGSDIQKIKSWVIEPPTQGFKLGEVSDYEIIPAYIEHLCRNALPVKKLKVVLDAGNGTASTVAPLLFKRLGAEVVELYCTLDGRFPNHHPDPTVPENLKQLVASVREHRADFGVAFDGDSDRIGLVDETGRIIYGDELMVIFSRDLLRKIPGATIISEVKSSSRLYQDIQKNGGVGIMWKTGHSLIKSKMKETSAALAGEMSGHIFFADRYFGYDDAIYAALRIFEIASSSGQPVSKLLQDLPPAFNTPEIRIDCVEELKFSLVDEVKESLSKKYDVNTIDGVRIEFGDSWGLVRASNTQPVIVMRFEAPSEKRLEEIQSLVQAVVQESAKKIGHPVLNMESHGSH